MGKTLRKTGIELIAEERRRQIEEEGFDAKHDESHDYRVLIEAALAYAFGTIDEEYAKELFPEQWDEKWWKPTTTERDIIKSGALLAAAYDRYMQQKEDGTLD